MNKVYHQIDNSSGSVINLRAQGVKYHELAEVSSRGKTSLAQVIKLDGDQVSLQVFAGARGIVVLNPTHPLVLKGKLSWPAM